MNVCNLVDGSSCAHSENRFRCVPRHCGLPLTAAGPGAARTQLPHSVAPAFCVELPTLQPVSLTIFVTPAKVDRERKRFSVTLKPALTASPDAALLASLFADLELAAQLRWACRISATFGLGTFEPLQSAALRPSVERSSKVLMPMVLSSETDLPWNRQATPVRYQHSCKSLAISHEFAGTRPALRRRPSRGTRSLLAALQRARRTRTRSLAPPLTWPPTTTWSASCRPAR